ncbi:MAG: flavin monoamine oxidase family protein, partial [Alphaproteobacteria bacterium]
MTDLPRHTDLAIVGAGAAGLAAAHEATACGLSAVVLEAADRIGGRAHTDVSALGLPFDRGCSWMHSGSLNPFPALADRFGFGYRCAPVPRRIFLDRRWADRAEWADWRACVDAGLAAAKEAGLAGCDVAAATLMRLDGRWGALFDAWLGMSGAVNADALSTLDYASYRDTAENWPVREGFGALVARWGEGMPVSLSTPVLTIRWDGPGVRLETARGTLETHAAIVTVSTGVLAADAIRFDPPLPDWKRDAVDGLPLGAANKVALRFARDVFGDIETDSFAAFSTATDAAMSVQVRPFGQPMTVGYVGGRFADALEPEGPTAAVALAV